MAEVLSQAQIDALLSSIDSGQTQHLDEPTKEIKVKEYDFNTPRKFTKEQLRTVDGMFENMGRLVASYFSGMLRVFSDVSVLQVEEQRYYEYNNALPDSALIGLVDLKPVSINLPDSTIMMDIQSDLAFYLIDRLLGGPGVGSKVNRDFTEIELAIMQNIYVKIAEYMVESWQDHLEVSGELTSIETNPRLIQVYAPEDIVVITVLSVKFRELESTISICIPAIGLEAYFDEFVSKYSRISTKLYNPGLEQMRKDLIKGALDESDLDLKVIFDETVINVQDALDLQPNDIIPLSKTLDGVVRMDIDGVPWFRGQLGNSRNKVAVKIVELAENEKSAQKH